jgi:hypothetical protein
MTTEFQTLTVTKLLARFSFQCTLGVFLVGFFLWGGGKEGERPEGCFQHAECLEDTKDK